MNSLKAIKVTPQMAARIRKHYLAQGVTETDIEIVPDEFGGALAQSERRDLSAIWRTWKGGSGFAVNCPACGLGQVFPDADTSASIRAIRFEHCGQSEKLPLRYRLIYFITRFLDRYAPAGQTQQPAPRILEF